MDVHDLASVRAHFKFPFTPYAIQADFMLSLTRALDQRALALFESPTGTVRLALPFAAHGQSCCLGCVAYLRKRSSPCGAYPVPHSRASG